MKHKTVLLRERKRHIAPRVASARYAALSHIQPTGGGGGVTPMQSSLVGGGGVNPILLMDGGTSIVLTRGRYPQSGQCVIFSLCTPFRVEWGFPVGWIGGGGLGGTAIWPTGEYPG